GVRFIVDEQSLPMLDNSCIDYSDSLSDAGFKVVNPNAARSCGCGTSFEPGPV
ncbi:MAG: iron-sulfur cluster assembly accessory protein, partial [Verrucomicrobia bacterium]|nr:iron-sulfur cluster assembly accessory protein [Verrucomicrobiota bacterium]